MIDIVNGNPYRYETKDGVRLYHTRKCKGRFKKVGFYVDEVGVTHLTYRCNCGEVSWGEEN